MRTVVRGVGQLLITLGVVVLLFVVYEVYVTDLFGSQKQAAATEAIDQVWAGDKFVVDSRRKLVASEAQNRRTFWLLAGRMLKLGVGRSSNAPMSLPSPPPAFAIEGRS